ncbi:Reverse transcriptase (RNA-dependent DNA polymerase) [Popillia japonica]|uniref:Reverse transcriptase (RNA-dependent DNA polymerase) n=1 Tax=Popillia japonica TaxID=7064 RepID=A0AAW1JE10_POPJA
METDLWGTPYKVMTEKIRAPTLFSTLQKEDGSHTQGWKESAELLMRALLPDDTPLGEAPFQQMLRARVAEPPTNRESVPRITETEVQDAIKKLKVKKAPGPDNIPSEVIQQLTPVILPPLTNLLDQCLQQGRFPNVWKQADVVIIKKGKDRDSQQPKSYRPICLLDNLGKVLEMIICSRLQQHRQEICSRLQQHRQDSGDLHPNQYAYRQGRSTEDAINAAVMATRETTKKYAIALFVDISGAFDNLWWPALYERLRQMNCPQQIYKIVRSYCQDRYANMRCPGETISKKLTKGRCPGETISKKLTKGCPQGSICGPIFWDIIMSDLLRTLEQLGETEANVAYADDLLLIITADSRAAIERKAMVITPACRKATAVMHKITRIAQRQYHIPLYNIRGYMNGVMATMVTYGASVWAQKARQGLLQFLTGHGPYQNYLYKYQLSQTDICVCGQLGTPEHILFECMDLQGVADHLRQSLVADHLRQSLVDQNIFDALRNKEIYRKLDCLATRVCNTLTSRFLESLQYTHQQILGATQSIGIDVLTDMTK